MVQYYYDRRVLSVTEGLPASNYVFLLCVKVTHPHLLSAVGPLCAHSAFGKASDFLHTAIFIFRKIPVWKKARYLTHFSEIAVYSVIIFPSNRLFLSSHSSFKSSFFSSLVLLSPAFYLFTLIMRDVHRS